MHCYLRGLNHKTAPAALREKLSLTPDASRRVLSELSAAGVPEAVVLATCNRTEFYVAGASPERLAAVVQRVVRDIFPGSADIPDKCWYDAGYGDAVQHLLRVAAGLDSMVLGEPEILGQVRAAWELALQAGSTGLFFNEVFQRCFRVAKRVRTETGLSAGAVSLASVAHQTLTADLGDLAGKRAVILGTGEIAGQMAKYLAAADLQQLTIVSHSADRASEFASLHGARGVPVSGLPQALARADALVTATSCPTAVVTVATMPTEPGRVSMIDLAHPRNIAPAVGIYLE